MPKKNLLYYNYKFLSANNYLLDICFLLKKIFGGKLMLNIILSLCPNLNFLRQKNKND